MWRSLLAAVAVYGSGHPVLDGYRPGLLDRPLQAFYREVNQVAREGQRAVASLDDTWAARYLRGYVEKADAQLRGSE